MLSVRQFMMEDPARALWELLHDRSAASDRAWRRWAQRSLARGQLEYLDLVGLWRVVLAFDPHLATLVKRPIEVARSVVLVAGSGKESFKTFNISTAASVLAAAAGVCVVKGVSSSVSAVSGSADVLACLGVPRCARVEQIEGQLAHDGIAFVPYGAFCPTYASRYDGVFPELTPLSFFMPAAVLAVRARAFVYGIAHPDVVRSASAIHAARPDLPGGTVVTTTLAQAASVDEAAPVGTTRRAEIRDGRISYDVVRRPVPSRAWERAVQHHPNHFSNAQRIVAALQADPVDSTHIAQLAEHNAALILRAHSGYTLGESSARDRVHAARVDGRAAALLRRLRGREHGVPYAS